MTPRERMDDARGRAEVAVATAGALTDSHRAAIKALHRASPERAATSCAADITMLELAARMAVGLPVADALALAADEAEAMVDATTPGGGS